MAGNPDNNQDMNLNITKGFTNLGNTCFYNATLQAIFRCGDLMTALRNYQGQNELLRYLKITIEDYFLKENVETIGPVLLLRSYRQMNAGFIQGTQADGEECLTYFLDNFDMATRNEGINITEMFNCNMASQLTCPNCNSVSINNSHEKLITLPIKSYNNFNDAFSNFLGDETLDDENLWGCENCKIKVAAKKRLIIRSNPKYLFIALKRFEHEWIPHINKIKTTKITNDVAMSDQITVNDVNYNLKGCVFHMGGLNGGHYIYYNNVNGNWIKFNDDDISTIINHDEINDIKNKGYVYLYEKI
jgi:ubiquitin C-terminal hydrolase